MMVKVFARKAAWLKFTAVNADGPTRKTLRSCYAVICEQKKKVVFSPGAVGILEEL